MWSWGLDVWVFCFDSLYSTIYRTKPCAEGRAVSVLVCNFYLICKQWHCSTDPFHVCAGTGRSQNNRGHVLLRGAEHERSQLGVSFCGTSLWWLTRCYFDFHTLLAIFNSFFRSFIITTSALNFGTTICADSSLLETQAKRNISLAFQLQTSLMFEC